jgi:hypothetical protein
MYTDVSAPNNAISNSTIDSVVVSRNMKLLKYKHEVLANRGMMFLKQPRLKFPQLDNINWIILTGQYFVWRYKTAPVVVMQM